MKIIIAVTLAALTVWFYIYMWFFSNEKPYFDYEEEDYDDVDDI